MISQGERRPLIAILDDDMELCSMVGGIMEDQNFEVVTYSDPFEALNTMPKLHPDVVISDVNMPKMDGLTFREKLLHDAELNLTPCIFLTARRRTEQRIEGLMAGADAYITKPFLPRELVAVVKNVLLRTQKYRAPLEVDPLTKSYNRNFLERVPALLEASNLANTGSVCAMIDIDHFKEINDRYGHQTGDLVLRQVADLIRKNIRGDDILVRYGGEEFLLLLPGQGLEVGLVVVERIRKMIASTVFTAFKDGTNIAQVSVTVSAGVSLSRPGRLLEDVIHEADGRLYFAKKHGRDQTAVTI